MIRLWMGAVLLALLGALVACSKPNEVVSAPSFRFAAYDFVVIAKPGASESALYGMDVLLANLLDSRGFTSVGDRYYSTQMTPPEQKRTLFVRMAMVNDGKKNLLAVSFDDAVSGRTMSSISEFAKGDIYDNDDRKAAFDKLSLAILAALAPETAELDAKLKAKNEAAAASLQTGERIPVGTPVWEPVPVPPPARPVRK